MKSSPFCVAFCFFFLATLVLRAGQRTKVTKVPQQIQIVWPEIRQVPREGVGVAQPAASRDGSAHSMIPARMQIYRYTCVPAI